MDILIAYDSSGSTGGVSLYHDVSRKIHHKYLDNCKIISWNSTWSEISHAEFEKIHDYKIGIGGTNICTVAEAILQFNFRGKLVLITDGEVWEGNIDQCDQMLKDYKLESVEVHLIGNNANMSVSCPFTRDVPHVVYTYGTSTEFDEVVTVDPEDFKILNDIDKIQTISNFETSYESLRKVLTARNMGKNDVDTEMHDKIVALKKRLQNEYNALKTQNITHIIDKLHETIFIPNTIFEPESWKNSLKTYQTLIDSYYLATDTKFEQDISTLLNITKGGLRNEFSHRLRRAIQTEEIPLPEIQEDDSELDVFEFECPISYDLENNVVLLIKQKDPIINNITESQLENIINCPLNALNYPEIVQAIAQTFDVACGLPMLKIGEFEKSPMTRADLIGQIYFGANISQVKATNHTISKMLTGEKRKKLGNMNLWYAVIYFILKSHPRFKDIMSYAENHMKWRLQNTKTNSSMSGLSQYMNVKVPLGTACWMVMASPFLHLPTKKDVVRAHVFHLDSLIELTHLYGAYLPSEINIHAERLVALYKMLAWCKKSDIKPKLKALYQRCIKVKNQWIPIDGPAGLEQIQEAMKDFPFHLSAYDILGLGNMVNPNLSADNIDLDITWSPKTPPYKVSWPDYGLDTHTVEIITPVCERTMRPYYYIGNKTWKDASSRKVSGRNVGDEGRNIVQRAKPKRYRETIQDKS